MIETVSNREGLQIIWQEVGPRNLGAVQQNRDDRNIALECCRYLDANEITRVVQASISALIAKIGPPRADHCEQYIATRNLLGQLFDKVYAKTNAIHVHEEATIAKFMPHPVAQATRLTGAILAAIA